MSLRPFLIEHAAAQEFVRGRWFKSGVLCVLYALVLTACGFALKGTAKSLPFTVLGVQSSPNHALLPDLTTALAAKGVRLLAANDPLAATLPRLALGEEQREKKVLSTTVTGRVREYQLKHSMIVQLFDAQGHTWLPPFTLQQQRSFSYSDSQALAKEVEERALHQSMQRELLFMLLVHLDAANKVASTPTPSLTPP
jgi:LPS-assembly lipoprotein